MSEDVRSVTNRYGRAHHLLDSQSGQSGEGGEHGGQSGGSSSEGVKTSRIVEAISGGDSLPPESTPHHEHRGDGPSDRTVVILSVLYIGGGLFMVWLGVNALRAMQKRNKEAGK